MKPSERIAPYLFVLPFFLGYLLFFIYPMFYAFRLSFFSWEGYGDQVAVGISNYVRSLTNPYFLRSIGVSFLYVLTGPIATFLALIIAVVLNNKYVVGANSYKLMLFLPYITMPVAIGLLFNILLGWDYGTINKVLQGLGLINSPINWLGEAKYVFFCVSLVVVWRYFGYHMVIYLGGMQSIDVSLYEAATIDGANDGQKLLRITLPLMKPFIIYLLITSINGGFNLFDEPMMLYGVSGGSGGAAQNSGMYIYYTTFIRNQWGMGSSISFIMFVITSVVSLAFYKLNYRKGMDS